MRKQARHLSKNLRITLSKEFHFNPIELCWTFVGAFAGISSISIFNIFFAPQDTMMLIGSFGASAVLVYGAAHSPLAQPRNLILGHVFSALVGVAIYKLFPETLWLSSALAVAFAIMVMQVTQTMHPPGGATALIANIGSVKLKALGFWYAVYPVLLGALLLFVIAWLVNMLSKNKGPGTSK